MVLDSLLKFTNLCKYAVEANRLINVTYMMCEWQLGINVQKNTKATSWCEDFLENALFLYPNFIKHYVITLMQSVIKSFRVKMTVLATINLGQYARKR